MTDAQTAALSPHRDKGDSHYTPRRHSTGVAPNPAVFSASMSNLESPHLSNVLEFEDDELRAQFKKSTPKKEASPAINVERGDGTSGGTSSYEQAEKSITAN